jgi:hypothetical protein
LHIVEKFASARTEVVLQAFSKRCVVAQGLERADDKDVLQTPYAGDKEG